MVMRSCGHADKFQPKGGHGTPPHADNSPLLYPCHAAFACFGWSGSDCLKLMNGGGARAKKRRVRVILGDSGRQIRVVVPRNGEDTTLAMISSTVATRLAANPTKYGGLGAIRELQAMSDAGNIFDLERDETVADSLDEHDAVIVHFAASTSSDRARVADATAGARGGRRRGLRRRERPCDPPPHTHHTQTNKKNKCLTERTGKKKHKRPSS